MLSEVELPNLELKHPYCFLGKTEGTCLLTERLTESATFFLGAREWGVVCETDFKQLDLSFSVLKSAWKIMTSSLYST